MSPPENRRSLTDWLLLVAYLMGACLFVVVTLELAARWMGLGRPVLYYNAAYGGARPLPNQHVTRLEGASVTVDGNGFRSARRDSAGAIRILYIGDSVTWGGSHIDDEDLFSEVAADALRSDGQAAYAMNAGVNGTGILNHEEIFIRYADSVDAVVWIFPWSDVTRTYATVGPLYPARFRPSFALVEAIDHIIFRFWLTAFRDMAPRNPDPFSETDIPAGYDSFMDGAFRERQQKNLAAADRVLAIADSLDRPLIIGVTPLVEKGTLREHPEAARAFLEHARSRGAVIFDAHAAFDEASNGGDVGAYFVDIVHYSREGNHVIGRAIGQILSELLSNDA